MIPLENPRAYFLFRSSRSRCANRSVNCAHGFRVGLVGSKLRINQCIQILELFTMCLNPISMLERLKRGVRKSSRRGEISGWMFHKNV